MSSTETDLGVQQTPVGAYGLRLEGIDDEQRLLNRAQPEWSVLRLERAPEAAPVSSDRLSDECARLRLRGGGSVTVDRATLVARFHFATELGDDEIIHPYLAGTAAIVSRWLDRETFHGGAFSFNGAAWALLGSKGAGKSSTLCWLANHGCGLLTDDLIVMEEGSVFPGPSCIDLRGDASAQFGLGEDVSVSGGRERWRVRTSPVAVSLPLRGWILLNWGNRCEIATVPVAERLSMLLEHQALAVGPLNAPALLDLAAQPCFELTRRRSLDDLALTGDVLLKALDR